MQLNILPGDRRSGFLLSGKITGLLFLYPMMVRVFLMKIKSRYLICSTPVSYTHLWQIRAAFLFGVAAFVLPMTVCAAGVLQGKINFFDNSRQNMEAENVVMLEENVPVIQEFTADGYTLSGIKIRIYTCLLYTSAEP